MDLISVIIILIIVLAVLVVSIVVILAILLFQQMIAHNEMEKRLIVLVEDVHETQQSSISELQEKIESKFDEQSSEQRGTPLLPGDDDLPTAEQFDPFAAQDSLTNSNDDLR